MALAILVAAALAQATAPLPGGQEDDVTVVGRRAPFRIDARGLRAAQAAFARDRAEFAPTAPLVFMVEPRGSATFATPPTLRLTDGQATLAVPIDGQGRFTLPAIPAGRWWLTADRSRAAMRVRPLILSDGSTRLDHRLGDARLHCRVHWAMAKASAPLLAAPLVGTLDLVGLCGSKRIGIYTRMPAPIRSGVLEEAGRSVPIELASERRSYRLPLSNREFGNDARIRLAPE